MDPLQTVSDVSGSENHDGLEMDCENLTMFYFRGGMKWNVSMCEAIYSNAWFHRTFCALSLSFFNLSQRLKTKVKIAICYTLQF